MTAGETAEAAAEYAAPRIGRLARAGGIDDALESLTALAKWPFMAIAVGLIAYGAYELLNARYRRIRVG